MPETLSDQYERIRNQKLQDSNKLQYNLEMIKKIKKETTHIRLPKLSNDDMSKLKEHLAEYKKIPSEEIQYKFWNLYNSFQLIDRFEDSQEMKNKIAPIIIYLKKYEYVIQLIIDSEGKKDTPLLDYAINILRLEINMFCMLYAFMLTDIDVGSLNFTAITPPPNLDDDETYISEEEPIEEENPFSEYENTEEDNSE